MYVQMYVYDNGYNFSSYSAANTQNWLSEQSPASQCCTLFEWTDFILQLAEHYGLSSAVWEWAAHRQEPECQSDALMSHRRGAWE